MAKTEKRKTGKDYQDDYRNAMLKVALVEARTHKRALELCKLYPDVVLSRGNKATEVTSQDFYDGINTKTYTATVEDCIDAIKKIEQWIADQHPHQQLNLYNNDVQDKPKQA